MIIALVWIFWYAFSVSCRRARGTTHTSSAGISSYIEGHTPVIDALLDRADQTMFRSKSGGRNRISVWEEP